jgi:hypothetical protein
MLASRLHLPYAVLPLVVMALAAPHPARGAWDCGACSASPSGATHYQLSSRSGFEVGCLDPCECPLLTRSGLAGSFVLVPYRSDPLFTEYLLCGIDWTLPASGSLPPLHITGEGWYRVGGEVAIQQELRLCVAVNGGETQRFESGLVPGGGGFPEIDIAAATSGFFCYDSVVTLNARPATLDVPTDRARAFRIRARPNPSAGSVDFEVFLPAPEIVSLSIVDIEGRSVRTLGHDVWLPAGPSHLLWDGTRSDGRPAAAGHYLVRLETRDATVTQSLIRLR